MDTPALRRPGGAVGSCGQQRVRKADTPADDRDELGFDRRSERRLAVVTRDGADQLEGGVGKRGGGEQRSPCLLRHGHHPCGNELVQRIRDTHGRAGNTTLVQRAGELQREERVALRRFVHGPERREGQDEAETLLQQLVQLPEAQALDRKPLERGQSPLGRKRQAQPLRFAKRQEERNPLLAQPPRRREQHSCGRPIEPVDVVDGDEHGLCGRQRAEDADETERHPALIDAAGPRTLEQKSGSQRLGLRRGQLVEGLVRALEQIPDTRVGELGLRLEWPGEEHVEHPLHRVDRVLPERRLPRPRLTLEQKRARPIVPAQELPDCGELVLPADDGGGHADIVRFAAR